jgi:hypothetical protein
MVSLATSVGYKLCDCGFDILEYMEEEFSDEAVEFKPSSPSGCSNNLVGRCDFRPDSWGVCHID